MTGSLRSTSGAKVYYSGRVVYNNYTDQNCGRYTTNTTSQSAVTRGGTCANSAPAQIDGMKYRVCRDINNVPDDCGSWSPEDTF